MIHVHTPAVYNRNPALLDTDKTERGNGTHFVRGTAQAVR